MRKTVFRMVVSQQCLYIKGKNALYATKNSPLRMMWWSARTAVRLITGHAIRKMAAAPIRSSTGKGSSGSRKLCRAACLPDRLGRCSVHGAA